MKEKVARGLYCMLAKLLPRSRRFPPAKKLRGGVARLMGCKLGRDVNIEHGAEFDSRLVVGDRSSVGIDSECFGPVTIGRDVMMGPDCVVLTRNHRHDRVDVPMIEQGYEDYRPVTIEDDVWIGRRVTILPGVNVGARSILSAGAVVTKDVEPYSVVGGVPARLIKKRGADARCC